MIGRTIGHRLSDVPVCPKSSDVVLRSARAAATPPPLRGRRQKVTMRHTSVYFPLCVLHCVYHMCAYNVEAEMKAKAAEACTGDG